MTHEENSRNSVSRGSRAGAASLEQRDEWLIDESIEETFPASDAISPARPGSIVGSRYPASLRGERVKPRLAGGLRSVRSALPWTLAACAIAGAALAWRRRAR